jgi:ABC-type Fe3+ transport system permease subunit
MLSGPDNQVLSTYVWTAWIRGDVNVAAALGVIMVVVMGALFLLMQKLGDRNIRLGGTA